MSSDKLKILIVHAHHEPQSFCSALARQAEQTLKAEGHTVEFADLYAEKVDPVSDRRNFQTVKDPDYLKQQAEESYASENDGFAPEIERELERLEACDVLIFSFPLWWFGMPAILKGWVDRVFVSGRIFGGEKLYENGFGKAQKRAMIIMTTGSGAITFSGKGVNPSLSTILTPVHHGVFWFNGFLPLAPFVAWSPARITPEEREAHLESLTARLKNIGTEPPQVLPPLSDFPDYGSEDGKKRFMVTITRNKPVDEKFKSLISLETERLAELKRLGILLTAHLGMPQAEPQRGFLHFRETDAASVMKHVEALPLAEWLEFEIVEVS